MTNNTIIDAEIERNYKHNFIVNFFDGTTFWFGVSFIAYRTILPVYISNLTNNEFAIALLSMIVATGWLLPQIFTAKWVQQLPLKKYAPVNVGLWAERLPILLLVPVSWISTISRDLALILSLLLIAWHILGAGAIAVGWQDMLAKIFPTNRRGKFFGITNFGGTATGVLGATTVTWLLNRYEFPYGYTWSFLIGSVFILISWFFLKMTREPVVEPQGPPPTQKEFWSNIPKIIRSDTNFRKFIISQFFTGGGNIAIGFLAVYSIQKWDLPDSQAGVYTVAMLIGQALSNLVFGALADRRGHKLVLEICAFTTAISAIIAAISPHFYWFYVVFFLTGISAAGTMLSGIMIVFEFCQPEIRPTYIGINNTIFGIFAIIMPFLGGWLARIYGYRTMFLVTFLMCAIGLLLLRVWVVDPRQIAASPE
jgi:MFS family permease